MLLLLLGALRPALTRGATGIGIAVLEIAFLARDVYLRLTLIGVSTPFWSSFVRERDAHPFGLSLFAGLLRTAKTRRMFPDDGANCSRVPKGAETKAWSARFPFRQQRGACHER
jgi:hypothetical protein